MRYDFCALQYCRISKGSDSTKRSGLLENILQTDSCFSDDDDDDNGDGAEVEKELNVGECEPLLNKEICCVSFICFSTT